MLRLDTRSGQVSHCSRSDGGWVCKVVPDERSALETEIARLQSENATLKRSCWAVGLPLPGVPGRPVQVLASRNLDCRVMPRSTR